MPAWLFGSLRGYDRGWLRGDLVAGLTAWAVLVPEALAYAAFGSSRSGMVVNGSLSKTGVQLYVARDVGQVRDVLGRTGADQRLYPTIAAAVEAAATRGS